MKNQTAFTLIELMIVVVLIAILTTYAIPNMRAMLINNRIVTKTNQLIHAINYARSEAIINANKLIQVVPIGNKWSNGWEIVNTSTNPNKVIKVFDFKNDQIEVKVVDGADSAFSYTSRGYLRSSITFDICHADYPKNGRRITVRQTGRANAETKTCS